MMSDPRRCHEPPRTTRWSCGMSPSRRVELRGAWARRTAQLLAALDRSGCWLHAAVASSTGMRVGKWRASTCARPCSIENVTSLITHSRAARAAAFSPSSSGSSATSPPGAPDPSSGGTRHSHTTWSMNASASAARAAARAGLARGGGWAAWRASASRRPTSSRTCLYGWVAHVRSRGPRSSCRSRGSPFHESSRSRGARKRRWLACASDVSADVVSACERCSAPSAA
mmetsp:Transcript_9432/g.25135  ORF Transcript_9432/g.25135 Transcript_9432/m.25135 type:complete len:228 (+) Transcript_9432:528-1211(+)